MSRGWGESIKTGVEETERSQGCLGIEVGVGEDEK